MLEHHIQRSIVYHLALAKSLRFSDLKPGDIENKLFTYHLKKVVTTGYVAKQSDGKYILTPEGRRLGLRVMQPEDSIKRPHSVLFLVIRRKADVAWLLYRRKNHPLKDKIGFMHAVPEYNTPAAETASRVCLEKTGLKATFKALGGGYFRIFNNEELESFTHFTLLVAEDASGSLNASSKYADYFWQLKPDFKQQTMLPNMPILVEKYQTGAPFFLEQKINL